MLRIFLLSVVCALCGCSKVNEAEKTYEISPITNDVIASHLVRGDFVLGDWCAVSNAVTASGEPPEGWEIACDEHGHFCPKQSNWILDYKDDNQEMIWVRSSRWEAVVGAWRAKGILDELDKKRDEPAPRKSSGYQWNNCDGGEVHP